jgi:hypothetical protein
MLKYAIITVDEARAARTARQGRQDMSERCEHNNEAARCCECLTAKFVGWEAYQRQRREAAQTIRQSIRTYRSNALGLVTIPD